MCRKGISQLIHFVLFLRIFFFKWEGYHENNGKVKTCKELEQEKITNGADTIGIKVNQMIKWKQKKYFFYII
jgi:hypothetical protein